MITITKEQFETYLKIQEGGKTNMMAINNVISLSKYQLTKENCLDIMKNYEDYKEKFNL